MKANFLPIMAALALLGSAAGAQNIGVVVNNEPVNFGVVGPREVNGRVLVPLRGVLEQIGAYVDWDAATQTVYAEKGDMKMRLPIGSLRATVNGNPVRLDVPAMTVAGTTMVPLRFVSEALGADVRWNANDRIVRIDTGETGNASYDNGDRDRQRRAYRGRRDNDRPQVFAVSTDFTGDEIEAGETMHITMRATPGGKAFFRIRGVVGERKMTEVSPGVYEASYTNRQSHDISISPDSILAFVVIGDRATTEVHPGGSAGM